MKCFRFTDNGQNFAIQTPTLIFLWVTYMITSSSELVHKEGCIVLKEVAAGMKCKTLLLTELVEEDLGIDRAFPWLFHVLEEDEEGCCEGVWTG